MMATIVMLLFIISIHVFAIFGASYAALLANFVTHFLGRKNSDLRVTPGYSNSVTITIIACGVICLFLLTRT